MPRAHVAAALVALLVAASCDESGDDAPASPPASGHEAPALPSFQPVGRLTLPERIEYIAVGGGAEPSSSQVSLEQDLALLEEILTDRPGVVLHAGGEGAASVHEVRPRDTPAADPLLRRLGELLDPREGRRARFRESALSPSGPSSMLAFERALLHATEADGDEPLFIYLNGHGDYGETDADNAVLLWGGEPLSAHRLAQLTSRTARPIRLVVTSCYAGGFAELAFAGADPERGAATADVCGLFATTADRESSGCDPNPDRGAQEGFALHFLHALRGEDARGRRLAAGEVDFDGDGVTSLYEAHARARIAGRSIDVPTTTAERWLRAAVDSDESRAGVASEEASPVERAVAAALGEALSLESEASARERLGELDAEVEALRARMEDARADVDLGWTDLRIGLLERWPIIDDPWDPRFASTIEAHREAIDRFLDDSPVATDYEAAQDALTRIDEEIAALDEETARVTRLVRAHENIRLEARLRARGGEELEVYERLRACESTPLSRD